MYIREKISKALVNKIVDLVGNHNFHVVPLIKGNIYEIKLQSKDKEHFRKISKYLNKAKKTSTLSN